jgi:hypothetical protein
MVFAEDTMKRRPRMAASIVAALARIQRDPLGP